MCSFIFADLKSAETKQLRTDNTHWSLKWPQSFWALWAKMKNHSSNLSLVSKARKQTLGLFFLPSNHADIADKTAPMGSPSRGGGVSRLSWSTPFSPIFVCPSAYRNLSPVLLFTHQLLPTYLQFSSSDNPFCLHRPFTYISLLYKPSFATSLFLTHFQSLEVGRCLPSGRGENRASTHNDKHGRQNQESSTTM